MDNLIRSLPAVLSASAGSPEVAEAACLAGWKHAVGEALSIHAVPMQLQNDTLVIAVADAVWKRQLEQMRDQFLYRLNSLLGKPLVRSLEFRIAPEAINRAAKNEPDVTKTEQPIPIELLSAAAQIDDPALRRAFLGAAVSCVNRIESRADENS